MIEEAVFKASAIIIYVAMLLINGIMALIIKSGNKKKSWGDFWTIFGFTAIFGGILTTFIVLSPNTFGELITKFSLLFA